jgi:hypothetical protein
VAGENYTEPWALPRYDSMVAERLVRHEDMLVLEALLYLK